MPRVTLVATGRVLDVPDGGNLREAFLRADARLYDFPANLTNCGGRARCGTCAVGIAMADGVTALTPPTPGEKQLLPHAPQGIRLACQANVVADCAIDVRIRRRR